MNKIFKRFAALTVIVLSVLLLVACNDNDDKDIVTKAMENLKVEHILGDNESKDQIINDLDLKSKDGEVEITWESSNEEVISNEGKVNRPEGNDEEVTMTATFKLNKVEEEKDFKLKVLKIEDGEDTGDGEDEEKLKVVTLSYTGEETIKFSEDETVNNAELVNLNPDLFEVLGTVNASYNNPIGLNKNQTIRLYSNRDTGNGNRLAVIVKEGYEIVEVEIDFNINEKSPATNAKLALGENLEDLLKDDIVSTKLTRKDLSINGFSLTNTYQAESGSNQIHINNIKITYKEGTPESKLELEEKVPEKTNEELVLEAKEALTIDTNDVTEDKVLKLPSEGLNDSTIKWEVVEGEDFINLETGKITMPEESENLVLKATITIEDAKADKEFTIKLVYIPKPESPSVEYVENFENSNLTGSYEDDEFIGANGVLFKYIKSRNGGEYMIENGGILFQNNNSELEFILPNGFINFSFEYRKAFTGDKDRKVEIFINDELYETIPKESLGSGKQETIYTFNYVGEALEGPVVVKLNNLGAQITIGNIKWSEIIDEEEALIIDAIKKVSIEEEVLENKTINLPNKIDEVSISWKSDNEAIISNEGIVNIVPRLRYTVTLTATFKLNDSEMIKVYNVEVGETGLFDVKEIEDIELNLEVILEGNIIDIPANGQHLLEDESGKIIIFTYTKFEHLKLGNKVKVTGLVGEFKGVKQLVDITSVELIEEAKLVDVTFISDDVEHETVKVPVGYKVKKPSKTPNKAGFEFIGWFDESLEQEFDFDQIIKGDIKVYAKWIESEEEALLISDFGKTDGGSFYTEEIEGKVLNGDLDEKPEESTNWILKGGNYNNKGWDYIRMGGRLASSLEEPNSFLQTDFVFEEIVSSIEIKIVGLKDTIKIHLQKSTDKETWTNVESKDPIIGDLKFDDLNIEANTYFRIVIERNATSNNTGVDIKTIQFNKMS